MLIAAVLVLGGCNRQQTQEVSVSPSSQAASSQAAEPKDAASSETSENQADTQAFSEREENCNGSFFRSAVQAFDRVEELRAQVEQLAGQMQEFQQGLAQQTQQLLAQAEDSTDSLAAAVEQLEAISVSSEEAIADLADTHQQAQQLLDTAQQAVDDAQDAAQQITSQKAMAQSVADLAQENVQQMQQMFDQLTLDRDKAQQLLSSIPTQLQQLIERLAQQQAAQAQEQEQQHAEEEIVIAQDEAITVMLPTPQEEASSNSGKAISVGSGVSSSRYDRQTQAEAEMLRQINDYRTSLGLPEVKRDSELDRCAVIRCEEMLDHDVFSHTRPDGSNWDTVLTDEGVDAFAWGEIQYRVRGENVITSQSQLAQRAMNGWKGSSGHDAILRTGTYDRVGIAAYYDGNQCWIANIIFIQ